MIQFLYSRTFARTRVLLSFLLFPFLNRRGKKEEFFNFSSLSLPERTSSAHHQRAQTHRESRETGRQRKRDDKKADTEEEEKVLWVILFTTRDGERFINCGVERHLF